MAKRGGGGEVTPTEHTQKTEKQEEDKARYKTVSAGAKFPKKNCDNNKNKAHRYIKHTRKEYKHSTALPGSHHQSYIRLGERRKRRERGLLCFSYR